MKLENDFNAMFVIVDSKNKGYLTVEELTDFYQTLFCNEIDLNLVGKMFNLVLVILMLVL